MDAVLDEIVGLPGFSSAGIGLTSVAEDRPGLSPETVQPEDLVVAVTFSDAGVGNARTGSSRWRTPIGQSSWLVAKGPS